MSNRIKGFVITLEKDIRDDDSESVQNAIRMIKGVVSVSASVVDPDDHINRMQIRTELSDKLFKVLYPEDK